MGILSGDEEAAVFINRLKRLKQKRYLIMLLCLLLGTCFQTVQADCTRVETLGSCQRGHLLELPATAAQLFVFVSDSMPEQSLKQWLAQAERAGGTLVMRGFIEDSPVKTVERIKIVLGEAETRGFSIDPERFEQMNIHQVPAVAVVLPASACEKEDCPKPVFGVVYGDVPLDAALLAMAHQNPGTVAETALTFLDHYRNPP